MRLFAILLRIKYSKQAESDEMQIAAIQQHELLCYVYGKCRG